MSYLLKLVLNLFQLLSKSFDLLSSLISCLSSPFYLLVFFLVIFVSYIVFQNCIHIFPEEFHSSSGLLHLRYKLLYYRLLTDFDYFLLVRCLKSSWVLSFVLFILILIVSFWRVSFLILLYNFHRSLFLSMEGSVLFDKGLKSWHCSRSSATLP